MPPPLDFNLVQGVTSLLNGARSHTAICQGAGARRLLASLPHQVVCCGRMRLNDILALTGASKKSIYRWMDAHPTITIPDPDSLLGHAFPRPVDQAGRAMVWDADAVSAWWRENAGTVGRHPVLKHNATFVHSRYIHPENTTGGFMENNEGIMGSYSYDMVESEGNQRTVNNGVRHQYRVLTEDEKALMVAIKDKGQEFLDLLDSLTQDRETALARTKIEEAVMWAVKGLTK